MSALGYIALAGWAICACGWAIALASWRRERNAHLESVRYYLTGDRRPSIPPSGGGGSGARVERTLPSYRRTH